MGEGVKSAAVVEDVAGTSAVVWSSGSRKEIVKSV